MGDQAEMDFKNWSCVYTWNM